MSGQHTLLVLVDGSNVAHAARWLERVDDTVADAAARLVERCAGAAGAHGWEVLVTFDGLGPHGAVGERHVSPQCSVVATGSASADSLLEREAAQAAAAGRAHWLVTSDRGLRDVAGGSADRVLGARAFLAELGAPDAGARATEVERDAYADRAHGAAGSPLRERVSADVRGLLERLRRGAGG